MWTYEQITGKLRDLDGNIVGVGYAGRDFDCTGNFVGGKNNPAKENIENIGPLPGGVYLADRLELVHAIVGRFAIHLKPDQTTEAKIIAYGRQPLSFFIHGDSLEHPGSSSDGCIVQTLSTRQQLWNSGDRILRVVPSLLVAPSPHP
ncbi:MAG TPA: hypothetical protein VK828_04430 [Terriglobales bacterium]|nr:hypothetical protein [Terriglobales bacterium]